MTPILARALHLTGEEIDKVELKIGRVDAEMKPELDPFLSVEVGQPFLMAYLAGDQSRNILVVGKLSTGDDVIDLTEMFEQLVRDVVFADEETSVFGCANGACRVPVMNTGRIGHA